MTRADDVRAALASAGYTRRQVTVRDERYGSPKVTIRDASVRLGAVRASLDAAIPPRKVYADGDDFLCAGYDVAYLDAIVSPIADEIQRRLVAASGRIVEVAPGVRLSHDGDRHHATVTRWPIGENVGSLYCYGVRHAAERVAAEEVLGRGIGLDVPAPAADPDAWLDRLSLDDDPNACSMPAVDGTECPLRFDHAGPHLTVVR